MYQIATIVRECAEKAVETQCTTSSVGGSNLKFVSCQQTCSTDGCNRGWRKLPKLNEKFSENIFLTCK